MLYRICLGALLLAATLTCERTDAFTSPTAPFSTRPTSLGHPHRTGTTTKSPNDNNLVLYANGQFRSKVKNVARRIFRRNKNAGEEAGSTVSEPATKEVEDIQEAVEEDEDEDGPPRISDEESQQIASKVDSFFDSDNLQEALELLRSTRYLDEDLFWRYVKAQYIAFENSESEIQKERFLRRGFELAIMGLEQDFASPENRDHLLKLKVKILDKLDNFQSS